MSEYLFDYPFIAYRGMWDSFGEPGSIEAIKRSWMKRIPAIVNLETHKEDDLIEVFSKKLVEYKDNVPMFFKINNSFEHYTRFFESIVENVDIYIICEAAICQNVYKYISSEKYEFYGLYLSIQSYIDNFISTNNFKFSEDISRIKFIIFESVNVLQKLDEMKQYSFIHDKNIVRDIEEIFKKPGLDTKITIVRVTDLVECDLSRPL
ncbi:MAG: hypothetical protein PHC34_12575 [Candidatus Gastranaerophilales bacterium]|nr:hypothetical protein [Candidatus Gastranaerophilales bacterium]